MVFFSKKEFRCRHLPNLLERVHKEQTLSSQIKTNNWCPVLFFSIYFKCMNVLLYVCLCVRMPGALRGQERALDPLGLELQLVMNHYVAAESTPSPS